MRLRTPYQIFLGLCLLCLALAKEFAEEPAKPKAPEPKLTTTAPVLDMSQYTPVMHLSIACDKGYVRINLATGSVTYDNCNPPDAAKAFWEAVTKAYPDIKKAIKDSK